MNFWPYLKDQNINYYAHGVKYTNIRARLLPADKMVETAFDPYIFVRDAYMQRDEQKIAKNQALGKSGKSIAEEAKAAEESGTTQAWGLLTTH